jgi:hypothetical protein
MMIVYMAHKVIMILTLTLKTQTIMCTLETFDQVTLYLSSAYLFVILRYCSYEMWPWPQ